MIDFDLSDEHKLSRADGAGVGGREVAPKIAELDRAHPFDPKILPQMADLGPARHLRADRIRRRGHGLHQPRRRQRGARIRRHVAARDHVGARRPQQPLDPARGAPRIRSSATSCRRRRGLRSPTFGLTEPSAGSDARGIQSVAIKKGDRYMLSGEKMWISLADVRRQLPGDRLVRPRKEEAEGSVGPERVSSSSARSRASPAARSSTSGASSRATPASSRWTRWKCPAENLLGREGEGFKIAMFALDQGRFTVAAGATGLIRACRDALGRLRERAQDVRRRDRPASARQGDDRADGVRLSGVAAALAAFRLAEESRPPQHARKPASPSGSRRSPPSAPPATRCRFTAPTATPTNIRSAASIATARARSSTKARARSTR